MQNDKIVSWILNKSNVERWNKKKINNRKKKKKLFKGQTKIFSWKVKLNEKIALTKGKINKKNKSQIEKTKTNFFWLNDEIRS